MYQKVLFAGASALVLAGCGSNVEPGFVAKQWAGEMRELQINPVFPPREDFQVGDIYLPAVPQDQVDDAFDEEGYLPISTWMMEAGGDGAARGALNTFYMNRSTYPQTSKAVVDAVKQQNSGASETGQNGGNGGQGAGGNGNNSARGSELSGPVPQPVLDCADVDDGSRDSCSIFTDDEKTKMRRMRIVGFPTFLSTTITQGNLSAFVPVEAFSAALGLDVGDVEAVSVNVPVAESVGVPAITALELAKKSLSSTQTPICPGNLPGKSQRSSGSSISSNDAQTTAAQQDTDKADEQEQERKQLGAIAALLPNGQREPDGRVGKTFHAIVVNEVFYTRAIEISVETQQSFGLGARLQTLTPTGIGGGSGGTGQQGEGSGGDGGADPSSQPGAQRATSAPGPVETYNRLLNATSNLPSAPGGSLQVVSVADGNIGMRRMFDRPIAIGYRGVSLLVDSQTCNVIGGGPVGDLGSGGTPAAPLGSVLQTRATEDASDDPQGEARSTPGTRGGGTSRGSGMSMPLEEDEPADM